MSLTKEQLAFRRTGLTATDMVVLAGESPYGDTKYDVFSEKCIPNPPERPSTEAMEWGNRIEPLIVQAVAKKMDVDILYPCDTAKSHKQEWALATVDARILAYEPNCRSKSHVFYVDDERAKAQFHSETERILECKVAGMRAMHKWPDMGEGVPPPDFVTIQATWQMFVTGVHKCTVAALLGTELRTYELNYDEELAGGLIEIGEQFWVDHVLPKKAPPADGSEASREMLARLWPKAHAGLIPADDNADMYARAYAQAKKQEKEAKKAADIAAAKLQEMAQGAEGIEGSNWRLLWKNRDAIEVPAYKRDGYRHFDLKFKKGEQ